MGDPGRRSRTRFALGCYVSPRWGWGFSSEERGNWKELALRGDMKARPHPGPLLRGEGELFPAG
jgi:hypothetical protein